MLLGELPASFAKYSEALLSILKLPASFVKYPEASGKLC